ncbi:MAG TPA: sigma-70 family RNA polymerase sigma factor [Planctomycetota bacterium]|nr:sigma-70 family RNA polymerase sigma factor [Planctomycetota bacterium]
MRPEDDLSPHTDPSRWDQLIEEIRPAAILVVIASSMSKSLRAHCSAEDIWQETLAQAWGARDEYQWRGSVAFRAWIFEIARNRIRDAARSMKTEKRGAGRAALRFSELESGLSSALSRLLPPDSVTPSRILMHAERAAAMQAALAALPPELEPVVRMHLFEDLTMEVIAERLGIGVSMAWRRFRKGSAIYSRHLADRESGRDGCS